MPEEQVKPLTLNEKLLKIKLELRKTLNKKSGYNQHSKFYYYQLEDFMPQVLELFSQYSIYSEYYIDTELVTVEETTVKNETENTLTTTKKPVEYAYLYLQNLENEDDEMVYKLRTAEASVYGASAIQNLGAKITYMKRYLYMSLLDIVEPDAVDAAPQGNVDQVKQQATPQPTVNYTTNIAEMHKTPEPPASYTTSGVPVGYPVHDNVATTPITKDTTVEEAMSLETKTIIAQMLINKGKNPADSIQDISKKLGTPVEQFKENQKETIINMINKM